MNTKIKWYFNFFLCFLWFKNKYICTNAKLLDGMGKWASKKSQSSIWNKNNEERFEDEKTLIILIFKSKL